MPGLRGTLLKPLRVKSRARLLSCDPPGPRFPLQSDSGSRVLMCGYSAASRSDNSAVSSEYDKQMKCLQINGTSAT